MMIDYPQEHQLPQLRLLWKEAFGDEDSFISCFYDTAFAADRCRCVTLDEQVAAALYWLDCRCGDRPMAYLYAIATEKKYRGRGICRALMENTHALLQELGYAGAILVPGEPELFKMYASMGYESCGGIREFSCQAADPVTIRSLSAEEYAVQRRSMLPDGGVIQVDANLDFLAQLVHFYAGPDCIFCADVQENELFCPEILGNPDAAAGIAAALHCESGTFRTRGEDPFAMYRPLSGAPAPTYFAFAFD